MTKPLCTWPRRALIIAIILLPATGCGEGQRLMKLGAKPGSSKEEGTRQPEEGATQVLEVPHDDQEETWSPFEGMGGRLLGGMQRGGDDSKEGHRDPGGDEKVRVEEKQGDAEAETVREQDAKQFTRSIEFATQEMPNASFTHPPAATQYGFKAKKIDTDGNCLFRAVADQLENQLGIPFVSGVSPYMVLRRIAANHIISNIELYKPFTAAQTVAAVEKLIADIEQDREWAGDEALAILSRALQVTIVVVRDKATNVTVYKPAGTSNGILYLYYKNHSHYESLYRDSSIRATARLEDQVKSQAADTQYPYPEKGPDLTAFLKDTASAIEKEWAPSRQSQWGAAALAKRKEGPTPKELAEIEIKKRKAEIAKLYATLSQNQADTKALGTLLKELEKLLELESLWGAEQEDAQSYLEQLQARYGVGNKEVTALLEKAYSQTLTRVVEAGQLEQSSENTTQLVAVLDKLARLHQAQGAQTGKVKYYTDAAVLYQTILHACARDKGQDHGREAKAVYEGLAKARAGMLACCKATGKPLGIAAVQAEVKQDREELQQLRAYAKQRVDALDAIIHREGMTQEEERKADETFIKGSEKLFGEITEGMKQFMARLYKECEQELGPVPCKYTVIGMGSMALQHITPYSDLELAIIMETPKDKATAKRFRDYLRKLTHLFHFRIINLGETVVPVKRYGVSLDHICHMGVQFDLGGKTPLNRIDKDKPYDLVQSVAGMMRYLKNEDEKAEHADKLLPYLLESTCPIHGDTALYETYAKERATFLTTGKTAGGIPVYQARALHLLVEGITDLDYCQPKLASGKFKTKSEKKGTLYQFAPKLIGDTKAGQLYNVKQEIYRLPDRLLYGLAGYYGILPKSSWDAVAQLASKGIIKADEATHHLQYAASFATMLRLRTYLHHQGQSEKITMPMGLSEEMDSKVVQAMFSLTAAALTPSGSLFKYYYAMLPLHSRMAEFCEAMKLRKEVPRLQNENPRLADRAKALVAKVVNKKYFLSEAFQDTSNAVTGSIYYRLLMYDEALRCWKSSLKTRLTSPPEERQYFSVAEIHHNIGGIYASKGEYAQALEHLRESLSLRENSLEADHPDLAQSRNYIGKVYLKLGQYDIALNYFKKAYVSLRKKIDEEHSDIAGIYYNISVIHTQKGNYEEALNCGKKALDIRIRTLGKSHLDVADSYDSLAHVCLILGKNEEAFKYLHDALRLRKNILGEKHRCVAISHNNIARFYSSQKQYDTALEYFMKAMGLLEAILGKEHPEVAGIYNNIGTIFSQQRHYDKAIDYLNEGLRLRETYLDKNHPFVADSHINIGEAYRSQGKYDKAFSCLKKALELKEAVCKENPSSSLKKTCNLLRLNLKKLKIQLQAKDLLIPGLAHKAKKFVNEGDYLNAIEYYERLLESLRLVPEVDKKEYVEEAQNTFEQAIKACLTVKASLWAGYANFLMSIGQVEKAYSYLIRTTQNEDTESRLVYSTLEPTIVSPVPQTLIQNHQEIVLRGIDYAYYLLIHHYEAFRKAGIELEIPQATYLDAYQKAIDANAGQQGQEKEDAVAYHLLGSLYQEVGDEAAAKRAFVQAEQYRDSAKTAAMDTNVKMGAGIKYLTLGSSVLLASYLSYKAYIWFFLKSNL